MSAMISQRPNRDKPPKIALLAPYIDSIEVSTPKWLDPNFLSCVHLNCGSMRVDEIRDRQNPEIVRRHLLKINQPSRLCIELLQRYKAHDPKLSIYRIHFAFDVIQTYEGVTRRELMEVLKLLHLRFRRSVDEMHEEDSTLYSIRVKGRKSRPYRNMIYYDGKPSKITGEENAIHVEPRLERKRAVQAVEIEEPSDLIEKTPKARFSQLIVIKDHRKILEKITQRGIKLTQEDYPGLDLDYIEKRARVINRKIGLDYVSVFAKHYPKQFERLERWDCLDIEDDWNWAAADVQCDDKVGELRCLLPPRMSKPKIQRERL